MDDDAPRPRRHLASVFADDGTDGAWLVAETPQEAADAVKRGQDEDAALIELTLANPLHEDDGPEWNGRPLYLDPRSVRAIAPPMDTRDRD